MELFSIRIQRTFQLVSTNIHATLSSEANLTLKFEVKDWDTEEITVPPFN